MTDFKIAIEKELTKLLKNEEVMLEVPSDSSLGDYAFPCFNLSRTLRKNPIEIAKELSQKIKKVKYIEKIEPNGPYLNFFLNKTDLLKGTLCEIYKKKEKYGSCKKKKERVMIEYSQANTHKAFHVGHLRGTSLGESLARILRFSGYKVIQANYQGDTGAHVSKWLWCYLNFHNNEEPPIEEKGKWIAGIYVEAVNKIEENPDLQKEVDKINYNLENKKDKNLTRLWQKSRKWSLEEFETIYSDLNAHFDHYFFEREMEKDGKTVSKDLIEKTIAKIDDNATIIDLNRYNLGIWVLLRKDGTCLYSAKDIALAKRKFEKYKIDKSIYVVGNAQSLHLQQLFKTLELMGFPQAKKCFHLSFNEVRLPTGKMSSRTGQNILYSEMKKEIFDYTYNETLKRHPDWDKEKIKNTVKSISIASLKFDMLLREPNKPIVFDAVEACNFEGETGPYIQYAHARCNSILIKHDKAATNKIKFKLLQSDQEVKLVNKLRDFSNVILEAEKHYKVALLARYLIELSQSFNEFYHNCQVISEDENLTNSRILLVNCTKQVLSNGLNLLAIDAPKEM